MDWISGRNLAALGPLGRLELDGHDLADDLFRAYLDQILIDGFFHADPHPGNVLLTDDGRLAIIDLGMVARVSQLDTQDALIKLLLAISDGRGADAADVMVSLGEQLPNFDAATFRAESRISSTATRVSRWATCRPGISSVRCCRFRARPACDRRASSR